MPQASRPPASMSPAQRRLRQRCLRNAACADASCANAACADAACTDAGIKNALSATFRGARYKNSVICASKRSLIRRKPGSRSWPICKPPGQNRASIHEASSKADALPHITLFFGNDPGKFADNAIFLPGACRCDGCGNVRKTRDNTCGNIPARGAP